MRKLVAVSQVTLDGVMQAPGGPQEDPTGGFQQGGWSFGYWDEVMQEAMGEVMSRPFDLLLGRKTYEIFAAHWPYDQGPIADRLNAAVKHVASTTLRSLEWSNSRLLEGDVAITVQALKQEDGPEIQVHGSTNLLQTLLAHALIDEHRIWIFPVVAGGGKRLFADGAAPAGLELVDSRVSTTGVIMTAYRPAGEIRKGSFQFDEPSERELARRRALEED